MASLNLSGLKLNKDAALSVEEFQTLTGNSENITEKTQQIKEEPKAETAPSVVEKPKSSFTLSLSSLIGGDSETQEVSSPIIIENKAPVEETSKEDTTSSLSISIPGLGLNSNNNSQEEIIPQINIGIGTSINTDSLELDEVPVEGLEAIKSSLQEEPKTVGNEAPIIEEKKEFFKNFNVIDVFAEEKKEIKKEEPKAELVEAPIEHTPDIEYLEQNQVISDDLVALETPVVTENETVSLEGSETQVTEQVPELITFGGNETGTENTVNTDLTALEVPVIGDEVVSLEGSEVKTTEQVPELITFGGNETGTENTTQNVDQIKKDLTNNRKPGGISIFKKKPFIFSILGLVVLSTGVAFSLMGNGGSEVKTNIVEAPKPIIQGNNYQEGIDYSIQKNQKKNIKRERIVIPENTGTTEQSSNSESTTGGTVSQDELRENTQVSTGDISTTETQGNNINSTSENVSNSGQESPIQ